VSSSRRRGALAATALAAACALTLTACGAGNNATTLKVHADSAGAQVGDIKVRAVNIITTQNGEGPVGVSARIFNQGRKAEKLQAVRIKGVTGRVRLSPPKGENSLTVPAHGVLALGGEGHASATVPDPGTVSAGEMQRITFVLSRTGEVSLRAAVVPADQDDYADYGPSSVPSPSGIPTGDPSPRPSAPTGSPTAGAETTAPAGGATATDGAPTGTDSGTGDGAEAGH
jgi:hypothetical protein